MSKKRNIPWVLILITAVAIFARLYGLDLELLSPEQKASVILSISAGVLSVVGLYLLVKELFDEKLAALSSRRIFLARTRIQTRHQRRFHVFCSHIRFLLYMARAKAWPHLQFLLGRSFRRGGILCRQGISRRASSCLDGILELLGLRQEGFSPF